MMTPIIYKETKRNEKNDTDVKMVINALTKKGKKKLKKKILSVAVFLSQSP